MAERLGGRVLVARQLEPGPEAFVGMTRDPGVRADPRGRARRSRDRGARTTPSPRQVPSTSTPRGRWSRRPASTRRSTRSRAALAAVSQVAYEHPEIAEIDVNPLLLHGDDATAVDALVVLGDAGS